MRALKRRTLLYWKTDGVGCYPLGDSGAARDSVEGNKVTMRISLDDELAGQPIGRVRELMRFRPGHTWGLDAAMGILYVTENEARRVLRELESLGLIRPEEDRSGKWWRPTEEGARLANATAASPVKRASSMRILRELLQRMEEVRDNPNYLFEVSEAYVFGSFLSEKAEINDIDVMFDLTAKEPDRDRHWALCEAARRTAIRSGRRFGNYLQEISWPRNMVLLYLRSRKRSLSLHDLEDERELLERGPHLLLFSARQITPEAAAMLGMH